MKDLDNFDLSSKTSQPGQEATMSPRTSGPRGRWPWIAVLVAAALVVAVVAWWFLRDGAETPVETAAAEMSRAMPEESAAPAVVPAPAEPLPALDASDELVRRLVETLSAQPDLAVWLASDDLVRRFVVATVNVAEGESPRPHLGFLAPTKPFSVREVGSRLVIAPAAYERYRPATEVVASIDTAGAAELFRRLEPLMDSAYRDLGYPEGRFQDVLEEAVDVVLSVRPVEGTLELEPRVESYEFVDDELQRLEPIQKQLLRIGPSNLERVQEKVRELMAALEAASPAGG